MAATKSAKSAKNPTSGNDTPNTPGVSESAIAAMKVDELRSRLQRRGVKGTADLKKPELVKKLIKLETTGTKTKRSTKKSTPDRKNPTSGNDTPNTPDVSESAIAKMKVGELRDELGRRGVKGTADLKKPELVKRLIELETAGTKTKRPATKSTTKKKPASGAANRSAKKKLDSAAGTLTETKALLFAQTDSPADDEVPADLEVGKKRTSKLPRQAAVRRTDKAISTRQ